MGIPLVPTIAIFTQMYLSGYISSLVIPVLVSCFLSYRQRHLFPSVFAYLSLSNLLLVMPTQGGIFSLALSLIMPVFVMPTSCHYRRRGIFTSRLSLSCLFLVMPTQASLLSCRDGASLLVPPVFVMPVSCRTDAGASLLVRLSLSCPVSCHADVGASSVSRLSLCPACLLSLPVSCHALSLIMPTPGASPPPALSCPSVFVMPVSCHADVGGIFSFHALSLSCPIFVMPVSCHADGRHPSVMPGNRGISSCPACILSCLFLVMPTQEGISPLQKPARVPPYQTGKTFATGTGIDAFCFNRNQSLIRLGK